MSDIETIREALEFANSLTVGTYCVGDHVIDDAFEALTRLEQKETCKENGEKLTGDDEHVNKTANPLQEQPQGEALEAFERVLFSYKILLNNTELCEPKNADGSKTFAPWLRDCRRDLEKFETIRAALTRGDCAVGDGFAIVPIEPTEEMWGELARALIMGRDMGCYKADQMRKHLEMSGREIPEWLDGELKEDKHLAKGDMAVCIYKAMLSAAPKVESGWQTIDTAPKDGKPFIGYMPFDGDYKNNSPSFVEVRWRMSSDNNWIGFMDDQGRRWSVTHWMPLLPAPKTEGE